MVFSPRRPEKLPSSDVGVLPGESEISTTATIANPLVANPRFIMTPPRVRRDYPTPPARLPSISRTNPDSAFGLPAATPMVLGPIIASAPAQDAEEEEEQEDRGTVGNETCVCGAAAAFECSRCGNWRGYI